MSKETNKVTCVECSGTKCWKKGEVPSRSGLKQRYVCFDCGRTFYKLDPKPAKPKAKPKKKARAKSQKPTETA